MKKPPERYWTKEAIALVAARLNLRNEPEMQDWAYEVADPEGLDQYLSLFHEMRGKDDVQFVLADIIIQAFDTCAFSGQMDPRWKGFLEELNQNPTLHAYQVWYWSDFDYPLIDTWNVAPDMRRLSKSIIR